MRFLLQATLISEHIEIMELLRYCIIRLSVEHREVQFVIV